MEQVEKSEGGSLVRISTTRFGDISIDEARVIKIKDGMLGFEHLKKYVFLITISISYCKKRYTISKPSNTPNI